MARCRLLCGDHLARALRRALLRRRPRDRAGPPGDPSEGSGARTTPTPGAQQRPPRRAARLRSAPRLLALRQELQERVHPQASRALRVWKGAFFQVSALPLQLQIREEPQGAHQPSTRGAAAEPPGPPDRVSASH